MKRSIAVEVEWDAEAEVWIAACEEIGLFTEAATLDEMRRRVPLIASDLIEGEKAGDVSLHVELRVKFDEVVSAAA